LEELNLCLQPRRTATQQFSTDAAKLFAQCPDIVRPFAKFHVRVEIGTALVVNVPGKPVEAVAECDAQIRGVFWTVDQKCPGLAREKFQEGFFDWVAGE
jgi:hypothetical protein